jgi:hypothetical protein
VIDSKTASPLRAGDAGSESSIGDVRTLASPGIIDADPINARLGGVDNDLVKDQSQIDHAPGDLGTSGAQVPDSSLMSPRLS